MERHLKHGLSIMDAAVALMSKLRVPLPLDPAGNVVAPAPEDETCKGGATLLAASCHPVAVGEELGLDNGVGDSQDSHVIAIAGAGPVAAAYFEPGSGGIGSHHFSKADPLERIEAWRAECGRMQARNYELIQERDAARREIDLLVKVRHVRATHRNRQRTVGAGAGAPASSEAAGVPATPPPSSGRQRLSDALTTSEAVLQACLAGSGSAVDFERASEEELSEMREMRAHAAIVAMLGMALMQKYFGALQPSMLLRVHAAAWRPREAGGVDVSADSLVPPISRVYLQRPLFMLCLALLWLIGVEITRFLTFPFPTFNFVRFLTFVFVS